MSGVVSFAVLYIHQSTTSLTTKWKFLLGVWGKVEHDNANRLTGFIFRYTIKELVSRLKTPQVSKWGRHKVHSSRSKHIVFPKFFSLVCLLLFSNRACCSLPGIDTLSNFILTIEKNIYFQISSCPYYFNEKIMQYNKSKISKLRVSEENSF